MFHWGFYTFDVVCSFEYEVSVLDHMFYFVHCSELSLFCSCWGTYLAKGIWSSVDLGEVIHFFWWSHLDYCESFYMSLRQTLFVTQWQGSCKMSKPFIYSGCQCRGIYFDTLPFILKAPLKPEVCSSHVYLWSIKRGCTVEGKYRWSNTEMLTGF